MKRFTIKIIIAIFTFIIGIGAVIVWLNKATENQSNIAGVNNESTISAKPDAKSEEVESNFSPVIELWLDNKIKGNKVKLLIGDKSIVGELFQLNASKEKELIVTVCPNETKDYNPKCNIAVYEKIGKIYKKLLSDTLDWHYSVNEGEILGGIYGRWGKGNYKDLHIVCNGTENIYFYDGSEYKFQEQIKYTA